MHLTRQDLKQQERTLKRKSVPTERGKALLTELSAHEFSVYQEQTRKDGQFSFVDANSIMVSWCLIDDDGQRLFDPRSDADITELSEFGNSFVDPLFKEAQSLNLANQSKEETKKN